MRPSFALSLSFDGISLLRASAAGWAEVGSVPADTEDLDEEMARLRRLAANLSPAGPRVELVIPDEQIRYLELDVPQEVAGAALDAQVRAALDGATPYAVSDLVFDWQREGTRVWVAAVARETLDEAEAFAEMHGFFPLGFAAHPEPETYAGTPHFGPARGAAPAPETAEAAPEAENALDAPEEAGVVADAPRGPVAAPTSVDDAEDAEPAPAPENAPDDDIAQGGAAAEEAAFEAAAEDAPGDAAPGKTGEAAPGEAEPDHEALAHKVPAASAARPAAPVRASREAPSGKAPSLGAPAARVEAPARPDPEALKGVASASIASFEGRSPAAADSGPARGFFSRRKAPRAEPQLARPKAAGAATAARPAPAVSAPAAASPKAAAPIAAPTKAPANPAAANPAAASPSAPARQAPPPSPKSLEALERARRAAAIVPPAPPPPLGEDEEEAVRLTVFGARPERRVGGKPRYLGLVLTLGLLAFLAGVAAYASLVLDNGIARYFRAAEPSRAVAAAPAPAPEVNRLADPQVQDPAMLEAALTPQPAVLPMDSAPTAEELAEGEGEPAVTEATRPEAPRPETAALAPAPTDAAPGGTGAMPRPPLRRDIDPEQAQARYAATGIWQRAPQPPALPQQSPMGDLYVTSIDNAVPVLDAVALPARAEALTDARPQAQTAPAPFGTSYDFGPGGLVRASLDGTAAPGGYMVFAGRPPLIPPQRAGTTATDAAAPEDGAATTNEAPGANVLETAPLALPPEEAQRLAAFRPRTRPGDLVEQNERATLGGRSRVELASLRPRLRPASPAEQDRAALSQTIEEAATLDTYGTPEAEAPEAIVPIPEDAGTAQAIATSPPPSARPADFASLVRRALASPPANETVVPSSPTASSVARQATIQDALNLSRVNLIGIYGQPSSRRALVRLANGRYRKVKVGDQIDGGRVAAIGEEELRLIKSGRSMVLKMPQG